MSGTVIRGPWPHWRGVCRCPQCKDRPRGTPPIPEYLFKRRQLGMPSHAHALLRGCPWCHAGVGQACEVHATGRRTRQPHDARTNPIQAEETA
jgi:hypothetical protein